MVQINRRQFLELSATSLCGLILASCTRPQNLSIKDNPLTFYLDNKQEILKEVDTTLAYVQKVGAESWGDTEAQNLVTQSRALFLEFLPDLPFIGGDKNNLTSTLYQSALVLALFFTMQDNHQTAEDTGKLLYNATKRQLSSSNDIGIMRRKARSNLSMEKLRSEAEVSNLRIYPDDWVFSYIEGDGGKTLDYGLDYTECGICKYYKSQNAAEFIPYLCILDYPISESMNSGLIRTNTLGLGGNCCDFRYKFGRSCQMEWSPEFLKEG